MDNLVDQEKIPSEAISGGLDVSSRSQLTEKLPPRTSATRSHVSSCLSRFGDVRLTGRHFGPLNMLHVSPVTFFMWLHHVSALS
jgi:hypothetical protein